MQHVCVCVCGSHGVCDGKMETNLWCQRWDPAHQGLHHQISARPAELAESHQFWWCCFTRNWTFDGNGLLLFPGINKFLQGDIFFSKVFVFLFQLAKTHWNQPNILKYAAICQKIQFCSETGHLLPDFQIALTHSILKLKSILIPPDKMTWSGEKHAQD